MIKLKNKVIRILHLFGLVSLTLTIFYFSLTSGSKSIKQSRDLTDFIYRGIHGFKRQTLLVNNLEYLIRKSIGHYFMFFCLSYFMTITLILYKKKTKYVYLLSYLYGLFIALFSELLQFIPKNRNPSLFDSLLNYSGYVSFIFIFNFFYALYLLKNNGKMLKMNQ